jgi:ATP-binding cassette subfamily F protein 3
MLFVSHDQDFLNKLATDIYELSPTGVHRYEGNYDAYLYAKKLEKEALEKAMGTAPKKGDQKPVEKKVEERPVDRTKEAYRLEQVVARKENELGKLITQFEALEYGTPQYNKMADRIAALQKEIIQATEEWESCT